MKRRKGLANLRPPPLPLRERDVKDVEIDPGRVAIRGWGMATPLGADAETTWTALLGGRYITDHAGVPLPRIGEVNRLTQLGVHVAREAIERAGWTAAMLDDARTGLVVGTSKGAVEAWVDGDLLGGLSAAGGACPGYGLASTATAIASALRMSGPRTTLSAACSSGLQALGRTALLVESGEIDRAVVVAVESSLHPLFLGSFGRLGILARPGVGCRPFDLAREGFLMSEAAAAVCVERSAGGDAQIVLEHFASAADATHVTGSDPEGRPLRHCLERVVRGGHVDLVHAHGTATESNDPVELAAVEAAIGQSDHPILYSHKGALGHSLGAAGLVSVVINCMAHERSTVPPNVRTVDPLPTRAVMLSREPVHQSVRRSVALAAGFGGAIAAVSLVSR